MSQAKATAAAITPQPGVAEDYARVAKRNSIDITVTYFDPSGPPPAFRPSDEPSPDEAAGRLFSFPNVVGAIAVVVLLLAIFAVMKAGIRPTVRLSRPSDVRQEPLQRDAPLPMAGTDQGPQSLTDIAMMSDRQVAVAALTRIVLLRAADDANVRLGRSWTMRDAIRHIPSTWPHRDVLTRLAHAFELAHYGGRPVEEAAFQAYLQDASRVIGSNAA